MGNLLAVKVHAANTHDTIAGGAIASEALFRYPSLLGFCADAGYRGVFAKGVPVRFGKYVDISVRIKPEWELLPKRWVVERTFAWLGNSRRLSKDYEISLSSHETFVFISHAHTLLRRLTTL